MAFPPAPRPGENGPMRVACAVAVTLAAFVAGGLFILVLGTKFTVLDDDQVARTALVSLLVGSIVLAAGARAAWRRLPG